MNSRKTKILGFFAVLALGLGAYQLWGGSSTAEQALVPAPQATPGDAIDAQEVPSVMAEEPAPSLAEDEFPQTDESLPTTQAAPQPEAAPFAAPPPMEDYDDELAEGAEADSESMANFAHDLSGLMEKALESEQAAAPAFAELERCATDSDGQGNVQAQLICFANASRLSKEYPGLLGNRFVQLSKQNPKLVGLLENTGMSE